LPGDAADGPKLDAANSDTANGPERVHRRECSSLTTLPDSIGDLTHLTELILQ